MDISNVRTELSQINDSIYIIYLNKYHQIELFTNIKDCISALTELPTQWSQIDGSRFEIKYLLRIWTKTNTKQEVMRFATKPKMMSSPARLSKLLILLENFNLCYDVIFFLF